jgi:hypothetical protein
MRPTPSSQRRRREQWERGSVGIATSTIACRGAAVTAGERVQRPGCQSLGAGGLDAPLPAQSDQGDTTPRGADDERQDVDQQGQRQAFRCRQAEGDGDRLAGVLERAEVARSRRDGRREVRAGGEQSAFAHGQRHAERLAHGQNREHGAAPGGHAQDPAAAIVFGRAATRSPSRSRRTTPLMRGQRPRNAPILAGRPAGGGRRGRRRGPRPGARPGRRRRGWR